MSESTTIALIRAKQNVKAAAEHEKKLQEQAKKEALEKAFTPLLEIFEEVKDLPAKDYRWGSYRKDLKMCDHVSDLSSGATSLQFWGGDGNIVTRFTASWENGAPVLIRYRGHYQDATYLTLEDAKEQLLEIIAQRIILPEESAEATE